MDRRGVVFWGSSSQAVTGDCEPRRDTTTPPSHPSSMKEVEKESNMSKQDPQHHLVLPKNPRLEGYFGLHLFIGKKKKKHRLQAGDTRPGPKPPQRRWSPRHPSADGGSKEVSVPRQSTSTKKPRGDPRVYGVSRCLEPLQRRARGAAWMPWV